MREWLILVVGGILILNTKASEYFTANCSTPGCNTEIANAPAIQIKTNKVEPILGGYTNNHVSVWLYCTNCDHTNIYESEIFTKAARAVHVVKPEVPHRMHQGNPPPLPAVTNRSVTVTVPEGFELKLTPKP